MGVIAWLLVPAAALFGALSALRRLLYRYGWLARVRVPVPVIVVGNIAVGGAGKTPLTRALIRALCEHGFHPGVVSRGYGRRGRAPREVTEASAWRDAGDEPLVLAREGVPIWVGARRAEAAAALIAAHREVDVILSDDGLQHYALERDFEIAVVDAARGVGNGRLLPAGPLREPMARLATVDAIVLRRQTPADARGDRIDAREAPRYSMHYEAQAWCNLVDAGARFDPASLAGQEVVVVAGIAHPESYFALVRGLGILARMRARVQAFPDHHAYRRDELAFPGARAILMTEKDAVKCREFGDARMWFLPICAVVDLTLVDTIVEKLRGFEAPRDAGLPGDQGSADS